MNPRNIVFRVDASLVIGTGHVMRCLTLAEALRERGCDCQFICREHPGNLIDQISERGFKIHRLSSTDVTRGLGQEPHSPAHAAWLGADWRTDATQTRKAMGDVTVDWLVIDHYAIDERWERVLRPACRRLMVIDDLADRNHDCDLLLDQNLVDGWQDRYRGKIPNNCGMLLGPEYALMQPIYAGLHDRVPPREGQIRNILVYFGGADTDNLTGMTISAFKSLLVDDVSMDVVVPTSSPHIEYLRRITENNARIRLHESLPSLAPLMVKADLAIGAGGATSWERCCLGLPSLVVTLAENQNPIAEELNKLGLIRWIGRTRHVTEIDIRKQLNSILNEKFDKKWSNKCKLITDGNGTKRVCSIITIDSSQILKIRPAKILDEKKLLLWANDFSVRNNSFHSNRIDEKDHHLWFNKKLRDFEKSKIFIAETCDEVPIGQIRFELTPEGWEIDYSLAAYARGRKLGKKLLRAGISAMESISESTQFVGRVKPDNINSCKVFENLGFKTISRDEKQVVYVNRHANKKLNLSTYVVASSKEWHRKSFEEFSKQIPANWVYVSNPDQLNNLIDKISPKYIFFLHWNWHVPNEIWSKHECICFHMTDVPYGRGGSPLQNLIIKGKGETKLSALQMVGEMDAGPVYAKRAMSLEGRAEEIYLRAGGLSWEIIRWIIATKPNPLPQEGEVVLFTRRKPEQSVIPTHGDLKDIYNHIRMLDAPTYPLAYIDYGNFRLEFSHADFDDDAIQAHVIFRQKKEGGTLL